MNEYESSQAGDDPDRRAHLQRWREDDRAEEVWREIDSAAQKNGKMLPANVFIGEILGARRVAIAIGNRGEPGNAYRQAADQMQHIAKFLRKQHPYGMPSYPQVLAQMLDEAAEYYRKQVVVRRNLRGVLGFSAKSRPHMIFMSMVGNDLKGITGRWLDKEVAVLTEIAFASADAIEPEAVRWTRGLRGTGRTSRKRHR